MKKELTGSFAGKNYNKKLKRMKFKWIIITKFRLLYLRWLYWITWSTGYAITMNIICTFLFMHTLWNKNEWKVMNTSFNIKSFYTITNLNAFSNSVPLLDLKLRKENYILMAMKFRMTVTKMFDDLL